MSVTTLPVAELRAQLAAALTAVESGERILLTRHDRVVAALVPPDADAPSPLETRAAQLLAQLTRTESDGELPEVVEQPAIDPVQWAAEIAAARR